jgi:hypothetical protein
MAFGQYSFGESYFGQGDAAVTGTDATATFSGFALMLTQRSVIVGPDASGRPGRPWRLIEVIKPSPTRTIFESAIVAIGGFNLRLEQRAASAACSAVALAGRKRRRRFRMQMKQGRVTACGTRPMQVIRTIFVDTQIDQMSKEDQEAALALLLLCTDDLF